MLAVLDQTLFTIFILFRYSNKMYSKFMKSKLVVVKPFSCLITNILAYTYICPVSGAIPSLLGTGAPEFIFARLTFQKIAPMQWNPGLSNRKSLSF